MCVSNVTLSIVSCSLIYGANLWGVFVAARLVCRNCPAREILDTKALPTKKPANARSHLCTDQCPTRATEDQFELCMCLNGKRPRDLFPISLFAQSLLVFRNVAFERVPTKHCSISVDFAAVAVCGRGADADGAACWTDVPVFRVQEGCRPLQLFVQVQGIIKQLPQCAARMTQREDGAFESINFSCAKCQAPQIHPISAAR